MGEPVNTWISIQGKVIARLLLTSYFVWVSIDVFPREISFMAYQEIDEDHTVNLFCSIWAAVFAVILLVKKA